MQIAEKYRTISILEAIRNIESRSFRLPAIQRKFIWKPAQIIALFDSILQGYPINTFMMWHVVSSHIKTNFRFYDFLSNYCQRFGEDNLLSDTRGSQDFMAVIDGQQRLTSIYIGLKGTYAYKMPRVWWPAAKDDNILPPRKLYIDLKQPATFELFHGTLRKNTLAHLLNCSTILGELRKAVRGINREAVARIHSRILNGP